MDLQEAERRAFAQDTVGHLLARELLAECQRLQNQLNDPAYMYAQGRIHRHAILCREAELEKLRAELRERGYGK